MSATSDFYRARAEECVSQAAGADLDNVRDRYTRAADAWTAMADRLVKAEVHRAAQDSAKLAAAG